MAARLTAARSALLLGVGALFVLAFPVASSASLTPKLVVSSVVTARSQTLTISASKPMADDAVGRVQFYGTMLVKK